MKQSELNRLRSSYSALTHITIEQRDKLKATVGRLPVADLEQIADSGIPFLDTAANSVLVDRGIRDEDARIRHAADKIFAKAQRRAVV